MVSLKPPRKTNAYFEILEVKLRKMWNCLLKNGQVSKIENFLAKSEVKLRKNLGQNVKSKILGQNVKSKILGQNFQLKF